MKSSSEIESRRLEKRLKERFVKAMATYHLIEDDDRILVGLSGGKDSLLLTELLAGKAFTHPASPIHRRGPARKDGEHPLRDGHQLSAVLLRSPRRSPPREHHPLRGH